MPTLNEKYYAIHPFVDFKLVTTTGDCIRQIWQELVSIRHFDSIKMKKQGVRISTPWIDQAKNYYLDARNSTWRSSGLLYYYSFLNLAKTLIVLSKGNNVTKICSQPFQHGLIDADKERNNKRLLDYDVVIQQKNKKKNSVFELLYKSLTGNEWPFEQEQSIRVSDFIGYSYDVSLELEQLYKRNCRIAPVFSLVTESDTNFTFELVCDRPNKSVVLNSLPFLAIHSPYNSENPVKQNVWHSIFGIRPEYAEFWIITLAVHPKGPDRNASYAEFLNIVFEKLKGISYHFPKASAENKHWHIVPRLNLGSQKILWHPLLSDYLFSFVLSSVLRYHPDFFEKKEKDAFFAEAWCNQSAVTALRYFLYNITRPSLIIK